MRAEYRFVVRDSWFVEDGSMEGRITAPAGFERLCKDVYSYLNRDKP